MKYFHIFEIWFGNVRYVYYTNFVYVCKLNEFKKNMFTSVSLFPKSLYWLLMTSPVFNYFWPLLWLICATWSLSYQHQNSSEHTSHHQQTLSRVHRKPTRVPKRKDWNVWLVYEDVWQNVQAAFFRSVKVNDTRSCQALKWMHML